ncbi:hypothetical protein PL419_13450 [Barnesiella intestinihominis]|nr:hypothetical protein [Barnesiella intestinihominis]MDB0671355.1 hypothetical protein [Barnesiella intestinihominis]
MFKKAIGMTPNEYRI